MKKIILLFGLAIIAFSCKSTSATSTKLDRKSQVNIKGDWTITSITYPNQEYIKINSFSLADSQCFIGSSWKFVSNNNKGNMNISKAECPSFTSPITWFINKEGKFVMKVLNAGEKARRLRDGYVLSVANQTETTFQLVDRISVGNKQEDVVYQFTKN